MGLWLQKSVSKKKHRCNCKLNNFCIFYLGERKTPPKIWKLCSIQVEFRAMILFFVNLISDTRWNGTEIFLFPFRTKKIFFVDFSGFLVQNGLYQYLFVDTLYSDICFGTPCKCMVLKLLSLKTEVKGALLAGSVDMCVL